MPCPNALAVPFRPFYGYPLSVARLPERVRGGSVRTAGDSAGALSGRLCWCALEEASDIVQSACRMCRHWGNAMRAAPLVGLMVWHAVCCIVADGGMHWRNGLSAIGVPYRFRVCHPGG